jgi:hypothetical protein
MSDDELRRATERLRAWDATTTTQEKYAIYRELVKAGDPLTQMNMAHQRDMRAIVAAYLADQAEMHADESDLTHEFGPGAAPVPLTETELRMVEQWAGSPPQDGHDQLILRLAVECRRLRAQVAGHAERIAAQSELLSRRAEGWRNSVPVFDGHYFWRGHPDDEAVVVELVTSSSGRLVCQGTRSSRLDERWAGEWSGPVRTRAD